VLSNHNQPGLMCAKALGDIIIQAILCVQENLINILRLRLRLISFEACPYWVLHIKKDPKGMNYYP